MLNIWQILGKKSIIFNTNKKFLSLYINLYKFLIINPKHNIHNDPFLHPKIYRILNCIYKKYYIEYTIHNIYTHYIIIHLKDINLFIIIFIYLNYNVKIYKTFFSISKERWLKIERFMFLQASANVNKILFYRFHLTFHENYLWQK